MGLVSNLLVSYSWDNLFLMGDLAFFFFALSFFLSLGSGTSGTETGCSFSETWVGVFFLLSFFFFFSPVVYAEAGSIMETVSDLSCYFSSWVGSGFSNFGHQLFHKFRTFLPIIYKTLIIEGSARTRKFVSISKISMPIALRPTSNWMSMLFLVKSNAKKCSTSTRIIILLKFSTKRLLMVVCLL